MNAAFMGWQHYLTQPIEGPRMSEFDWYELVGVTIPQYLKPYVPKVHDATTIAERSVNLKLAADIVSMDKARRRG